LDDVVLSATGQVQINSVGAGTQNVIGITPQGALAGAGTVWKGLYMDCAALDPGVANIDIYGIHIDMTGVAVGIGPDIWGINVQLPAAYDAGAEIAGYFAGDGRWVSICTDTHAIQTSGDVDVTGDITVSGSVDGVDISAISLSNMPAAATGNIDCGAQAITNVGNVDGVDVSAHAADGDIHVAHSGVTITAGVGLSGGGTIAANRTIDCDITQYTNALAQAACVSDAIYGAGWNAVTTIAPSKNAVYDKIAAMDTLIAANTTTAEVEAIIDAEIVDGQSIDNAIDALINTHNVANRHIDHSTVSVIAGTGLSGGGTIAADRTINCDITQYTNAMAVAAVLADDAYVKIVGDTMTGLLTLTHAVAGMIDLNPANTGTQNVIDITPSANLVAGSTWKGTYVNLSALDPATGAGCSIIGHDVSFAGVTSVDHDATLIAFKATGSPSDNDYLFAAYPYEKTGSYAANMFFSYAVFVLSHTAIYRGLLIDWAGVTRDANAPRLEGVKVLLPADYTNFGTSYAGYFSGDGRTVTICDTTYALNVSGAMLLTGAITGVTTFSAGTATFETAADGYITTYPDMAAGADNYVLTYDHALGTIKLEVLPAAGPHTLISHTDVSLADPDADQIVFWDDSDSQFEFLVANTGLSIAGNNLNCDITQYTNAMAVAAVLADDAYVKIVGDTMTGLLTLTHAVAGMIDLNPANTGSQYIINITPSAALTGTPTWRGLYLAMTALDPDGAANIYAIDVQMGGISVANSPHLRGLNIAMPATYGGGTEYGARITGDGREFNVCTDLSALQLVGDSGTVGLLDINPNGTGTQYVIQITPSAALVAGSTWRGMDMELGSLDPATGAACTIHGIRINAGTLASVDHDGIFYGYLMYGAAADNCTGYYYAPTEMTQNKVSTGFYSYLAVALSFTATYKGLYFNWGGATRDANAPALQGLNITLPASYANFGTSYAGYFSGDGRSVTLCNTDWSILTTGSIYFGNGNILQYNANNDGNPYFKQGSRDADEFYHQAVYKAGTIILDYVLFRSDSTDAGVNDGRMLFYPDNVLALTLLRSGNVTVTGELTVSGGLITVDGVASQISLGFGAGGPHGISFGDADSNGMQMMFRTTPEWIVFEDVSDFSDGTDLMTIDRSGNVSMLGDLTVSGDTIQGAIAMNLIAPTGSMVVRADGTGQHMYFDAGGSFYWRDEDAARNIVAEISSSTGRIILGYAANTSDPIELLRFRTERAWSFRKRATGAGTRLALESDTDGKEFWVGYDDGTIWASKHRITLAQATTYFNAYQLYVNGTSVITSARAIQNVTTLAMGGALSGVTNFTLSGSISGGTTFSCGGANFDIDAGGNIVDCGTIACGNITVTNTLSSSTTLYLKSAAASSMYLDCGSNWIFRDIDAALANRLTIASGTGTCTFHGDLDVAAIGVQDMGTAANMWDECFADNWNNVSSWKEFADPFAILGQFQPNAEDPYKVDHSTIDDWIRARVKARIVVKGDDTKWEGGYILKAKRAKKNARVVEHGIDKRKVKVGNYSDGYSDEDFEHENAYSINKTQIVLIQAMTQLKGENDTLKSLVTNLEARINLLENAS
jgi:hypothetical protein